MEVARGFIAWCCTLLVTLPVRVGGILRYEIQQKEQNEPKQQNEPKYLK